MRRSLRKRPQRNLVRALKKQLEDRHVAVGCHGQLKKWTQPDGGFQKKSAITCIRVTSHAGVAQHKRRGHTEPIVDQGQGIVLQGEL
jgi:hypothetical protein